MSEPFYKLFNGHPCGDSHIADNKQCKLNVPPLESVSKHTLLSSLPDAKAMREAISKAKNLSPVARNRLNMLGAKNLVKLYHETFPAKTDYQNKEPWQLTKAQYREKEASGFDDISKTATAGKTSVGDPIKTPEQLKAFKASTAQSAADTRSGLNSTVDLIHKRIVEKAFHRGDKIPQEVLNDYPELSKSTSK